MNSLSWTDRFRDIPERDARLDVRRLNEHAVIMGLETTYRRGMEFWKSTVQNAPPDWSAPTPCTEWDARTLVNHVVGEDRWTKPLVDGRTIAEVGDAFDGDLLGEDPKSAALAAADEALTVVAERLPAGGKVHLSYGEEDIEEYIRQLVAEHLIHGWDLAVATGQQRTLDPELVAAVATWFRDREDMYRAGGSTAARPASSRAGDPQADLLIAFGRNPDWVPNNPNMR